MGSEMCIRDSSAAQRSSEDVWDEPPEEDMDLAEPPHDHDAA